MLTATCHCGAVGVDVPRRPRRLTSCNCSICRRYGTLWAYASGAWHSSTTNEPGDEQGVAQVAFASNAVEADWNDTGQLWLLRCWKYL